MFLMLKIVFFLIFFLVNTKCNQKNVKVCYFPHSNDYFQNLNIQMKTNQTIAIISSSDHHITNFDKNCILKLKIENKTEHDDVYCLVINFNDYQTNCNITKIHYPKCSNSNKQVNLNFYFIFKFSN